MSTFHTTTVTGHEGGGNDGYKELLVQALADRYGAGGAVGFSDSEYQNNNAIMQSAEQIYRDKELIIKFKGPSLTSIEAMREGCTLFCMAHFHSYPDRAKLLQDKRINVIAIVFIMAALNCSATEYARSSP